MIAVDTNVLVRAFINDVDNPKQNQLVHQLIRQEKEVYISQTVQMELVWVLESACGFEKDAVIQVLQALHDYIDYHLENPEQFYQALMLFKTETADFSDYLIFANSQQKQLPFYTFDKKLSRTEGVIKLTDKSLDN